MQKFSHRFIPLSATPTCQNSETHHQTKNAAWIRGFLQTNHMQHFCPLPATTPPALAPTPSTSSVDFLFNWVQTHKIPVVVVVWAGWLRWVACCYCPWPPLVALVYCHCPPPLPPTLACPTHLPTPMPAHPLSCAPLKGQRIATRSSKAAIGVSGKPRPPRPLKHSPN